MKAQPAPQSLRGLSLGLGFGVLWGLSGSCGSDEEWPPILRKSVVREIKKQPEGGPMKPRVARLSFRICGLRA